jgi:membrane dipeptidase
MTNWQVSEEASDLHADALVWDMTLPWRLADRLTPTRLEQKYRCLEEYASNGANFVSLTIASDDELSSETITILAAERAYFKQNTDKYILAEKADDILSAKAQGKLAVGFHLQGSVPVGRDLRMVEIYHRLGIRHMLMAYNQKNFVGDGCHERTDSGLSQFGVRLVKEMNRVGILVDCAHTGYRTTLDVFEIAEGPVIFSHTNAKKIFEHPRCITDDQIRACAASGGVMGVTGLSIFHGPSTDPVAGLVNHIDYIVQLVGPAHVGLGLDYVYDVPALQALARLRSDKWPKSGGYTDPEIRQVGPSLLPQVTQALLARGYAEDTIRAILGGNFLRVFKSVCG